MEMSAINWGKLIVNPQNITKTHPESSEKSLNKERNCMYARPEF